MYLGVPAGAEMIQWNAHRQYGPLRLPHLLANWEQVTTGPSSQPLYVVRRMGDDVPPCGTVLRLSEAEKGIVRKLVNVWNHTIQTSCTCASAAAQYLLSLMSC